MKNEKVLRQKLKKGKLHKIGAAMLSTVLVMAMVVGLMPANKALAEKVSDYSTDTKYTQSLGNNASTEYSGRIWSDKSVYSDRATFDLFGGGNATISKDEDSDFLVAFSALGTSQAVSGHTQAPVDVVFVIDTSGSMTDGMSSTDSTKRITNTVEALNASIEKVMDMNPYTRVAVVAFSDTAQELLPLGRYSKGTRSYTTGGRNPQTVTVNDYFSLQNDILYTHVIPEGNTTQTNKNRNVTGGTNIQMGLYTGMNILTTSTTTAVIDGATINRVPSVILLSDGAPTYSSSDSEWWAPENNKNDGPGGSPYAGNGMKALMTGAYMKEVINARYEIDTNVYTVGMGISGLSNYGWYGYTGEQDLAYMTLDPANHWTDNNNMANTIESAWNTYTRAGGNTTVSVAVNSGDSYTFTHPQGQNIIDIADLDDNDSSINPLRDFVDDYYDADSASEVTDVFDEIVDSISISTPEVPTEIKGDAPVSDNGKITYTDPLGEYMEVKDVKAIIYAGTVFSLENDNVTKTVTPNVDGTETTYTFAAEVDSEIYGNQNIRDIDIVVTKDADGNETLKVEVPASVIPVRVNTVTLNADGTVKSHTNNGAYPVRVLYTVGLRDDVVVDGVVQISELSPEYIAKNLNADGTINFYSNLYTGENTVTVLEDGKEVVRTAGNATVEFEPSHSNPFYYMVEDIPIYNDPACEEDDRVRATEGLDDDGEYYYKTLYYYGRSVETEILLRTGAQLKKTDIIEVDGYLYRAKGSPRLNRILEFEGKKIDNNTKTAADFYAPTFVYDKNNPDPYAGKYVIYLGNNGVVPVAASGSLEIAKTVKVDEKLDPATDEFEFTVNFNGNDTLAGSYAYNILDAEGKVITHGFITDGGKVILKDGEKAVISDLPSGTTYTVTETAAAGFTVDATGDSGTIRAGVVSQAGFINEYTVDSVTVETEAGFKGTKKLVGRDWLDTDSFTFALQSRRLDTPMPEGSTQVADSHMVKEVTVSNGNAVDGQEVAFVFGDITYTEPGIFEYVISEKLPTGAYAPGMSYSGAVYIVVVNVEDNGEGQLVANLTMTQIVDDSGASVAIAISEDDETAPSAAFTNTFRTDAVSWMPVGTKDYIDYSGQKPITNDMFKFKVEAITEGAPMPAHVNADGDSIVTNANAEIVYEAIQFGQEHAGESVDKANVYVYKFTEVNEGKPGVTYDTNEYEVSVKVYLENGKIVATPTYPENTTAFPEGTPTRVVFFNEYQPTPITAVIQGTKTLDGRDINTGENETFRFYLEAANRAATEVISEIAQEDREALVNSGKEGEPTAFAFEAIEFTKPGIYVFNVTEENAGQVINGVTYDSNAVTVTITVEDKDAKLEVTSIVYRKNNNTVSEAAFVNTYDAEFDGPAVNLAGTKEMTGRTLRSGEFFFSVTPLNAAPMGEGSTLVAAAADGTIALLKNVTYAAEGTYVYQIKEQIPNGAKENADGTYTLNGVTYDTTVYEYTVKVIDNKLGKLLVESATLTKAGSDETVSDVVFSNTYNKEPATRNVPVMQKILSGFRSELLKADEFKFTMRVSATTLDYEPIPEAQQQLSDYITLNGQVEDAENRILATVGNEADTDSEDGINMGSINFGELKFHKEGIYRITISEEIPEETATERAEGVTYSNETLVVVFEVKDNGLGQLEAQMLSLNGNYSFTNEYESSGTLQMSVKKELDGRAWETTDEFAFEMLVLDPITEEAINDGYIVLPEDATGITITDETSNYTTSFGDITFTKPGEYKFIIREKAGTIAGIHYDSTRHEVVVTATDNAEGEIVVSTNVTDNKVAFTNRYDTTSIELPGHDNLVITKSFTGRENNAWLVGENGDKFTFTLAAGDDITAAALDPTTAAVILPGGGTTATLEVTNANKAYPHFGNIIFNEAGTYTFTVKEEASNIPGVTDDPNNVRTIKVVVEDNVGEAKLKITSVTGQDNLTFENIYTTKEVKLDGAENLEVAKVLTGRNWFTDDAFTFTLAAYDDFTKAAIVPADPDDPMTADVILPANAAGITITSQDAENGYKKAFGDIIFKEVGTYKFLIKETAGNIQNVGYDAHSSIVTVVVSDDTKGNLVVAAPSYAGSMTFENSYTPDAVSEVLTGKKVLNERTLKAGEFRFHIEVAEGSDAGTPLPAVRTVANGEDGSVTFAAMNYTKAGTYKYKISEIEGNLAGITYDTGVVEATVEVTYDAATGKLSSEVSYVKTGEGTGFEFINTYTTQPTDPVDISAMKTVTPSIGNSYVMQGGEFQFEIEPSAANPDGDPISRGFKYNGMDGAVVFADAQYSQPGVYVYTVHEVGGTRGGITYDDSVYTITVTVTDDESVAKLKAVVEIVKNKGESDETIVSAIQFDNGYDPAVATAVIHGHKTLTGGNKALADGEFIFKLEAVTEEAPMPNGTTETSVTVTNTGTGLIQFALITYDRVGTYEYKVTEVIPNEATQNADGTYTLNGITYDNSVHDVTVTVTDTDETGASTGELKATVVGVVDENENPLVVFENTYTPNTVSQTISGTKTLTGRDMDAGEFTFILQDEEGNEIDRKTNVAGGATSTFTFNPITYAKVGEYNYTIIEKNTGIGGVTYDETTFAAKVVVTDEGFDGQLDVTAPVYYKNNEEAALVFENSYKATSTSATLGAAKVLNGRDMNAGEFSFALKAVTAGAPMPAENTVATNAADGSINFGKITYDKAGTYVYEISEVKGKDTHVTYDDTVHTVTVTVTDDYKGQLSANVTGVEKAVFNNTYTPNAIEVTFAGTKVLTGRSLKLGEFAFILKDSKGNVIEEAWNSLEGEFIFKAIKFEKAGSYDYLIEEKNTNVGGVTYDTGICKVHVEVTDDGQGNLTPVVTYGKDAKLSDNVVFTNSYKAAPVSIQVNALKELKGRDMKAGEFRFVLEDENGNKIYAVNAADGTIVFDEITFSEAGTYVYRVYEEKGTLQHVTYDETIYEITVTVEDDLNGSLTAQLSNKDQKMVFVNIYKEPPKVGIVQTGDSTTIMSTFAVMFMAAGYIVAYLMKDRRRK